MPSKLTTSEVIERCKNKWGDKYDYSKLSYLNQKTPITVGCPVHGFVDMLPRVHYLLSVTGCPKCGAIARSIANRCSTTLSTSEKKERALSKHKSRYDYSKTDFSKKVTEKVTITCNKHGDFQQRLCNHLEGRHCPTCARFNSGRKKAVTFAEAQARVTAKFGNKLKLLNYTSHREKCDIECCAHGKFKSTLNNLLKAEYGCKKCQASSQSSSNERDIIAILRYLLDKYEIYHSFTVDGHSIDIVIHNPKTQTNVLFIELNGIYYHRKSRSPQLDQAKKDHFEHQLLTITDSGKYDAQFVKQTVNTILRHLPEEV